MANTTIPTTYTYANVSNNNQVPNGGYNLSGAGLTYTTATGAGNWATNIATEPFYTKKPKVEITDKDLVIDGLSLRDFMHSVNERMAIMVPNPKLEEEFEELKALANQYRELERKLLEQKEMWETLKK
jgi:hypothetical protein